MSLYRWKYILKRWLDNHKSLNRRVAIENQLFKYVAANARPTPEDCRIMALRLGTPKDMWSERVREHKWSIEK